MLVEQKRLEPMISFYKSSRLLKDSIVLIDTERGAMVYVIVLQYNPETGSHTLQVKSVGEVGNRSQEWVERAAM